MITADEARKGRVGVPWRTNQHYVSRFTEIKNEALYEMDKEIREEVGYNTGKTSVLFSMRKAINSIEDTVNPTKDLIPNRPDRLASESMQRELELILCAELRNVGFSTEPVGDRIKISWEAR